MVQRRGCPEWHSATVGGWEGTGTECWWDYGESWHGACFRSLGKYGATKGFYNAFPGQAIVDTVQKYGGVMTMDDFTEERTKCTFPETIYVGYKGMKLHQVPPNWQGVAGLITLSGLDALEKKGTIDALAVVGGGTDWESS